MLSRDNPKGWAEYSKDAQHETARLGVNDSNFGPGYLEIVKTSFKDGSTFIHPSFYANNAKTYQCDGETKKFARNVEAPKGGYVNGNHAIIRIRDYYGLIFKDNKFNELRKK